jgi:hypothetical protein
MAARRKQRGSWHITQPVMQPYRHCTEGRREGKERGGKGGEGKSGETIHPTTRGASHAAEQRGARPAAPRSALYNQPALRSVLQEGRTFSQRGLRQQSQRPPRASSAHATTTAGKSQMRLTNAMGLMLRRLPAEPSETPSSSAGTGGEAAEGEGGEARQSIRGWGGVAWQTRQREGEMCQRVASTQRRCPKTTHSSFEPCDVAFVGHRTVHSPALCAMGR